MDDTFLSWVEVALLMIDGMTTADVSDAMPVALEFHKKVSVRMVAV